MSTEFFEAVKEKKPALVHEILEKANIDINLRDSDGYAAIHYAVDNYDLEMVKLLLSQENIDVTIKTAKEGQTPLHFAFHSMHLYRIRSDVIEILTRLIEKDKSIVNIPDDIGRLPIHYGEKFYEYALPIVELFANSGSNMNHKDNFGRTCLFYACDMEYCDTINYYLNSTSVDPKLTDDNGETPLYRLIVNYVIRNSMYIDGEGPKIFPLIDRTFVADPITGEYNFNEFYPVVMRACSNTNQYMGICDYLMRKLYSQNNSKYYFYEKIEASDIFEDSETPQRFYIYSFLHDKIPKSKIKSMIKIDEFINSFLEFLRLGLRSNGCNSMILELFEYLDSIEIYQHLMNFEENSSDTSIQKMVGRYFCYYHESREFLNNLIMFFIKKEFNMNDIFYGCLKSLDCEGILEVTPLLIPYTTKHFEIITEFYENHAVFINQSAYDGINNHIKCLLQNYGDCEEIRKMPEFESQIFSLKRLSRDCFRRNLIKNTKTNSEFFEELNKLKDELPKSIFAYLKLEV